MRPYILYTALAVFLSTSPAMAKSELPDTPEQSAASQISESLDKAGQEFLKSGGFVAAESAFRSAISAQYWDAQAYRGLAQALTGQGKTSEAIQIYRTLIYELPVRTGISSNNPKEIEAYRARVYQDPTKWDFGSDSVRVWMNYIVLLCQTGQWPEAASFYEKVVSRVPTGDLPSMDLHFSPGVPMLNQLLAAAHTALGIDHDARLETAEALAEYDQAWRLQPDSALVNFYYGYGFQRIGRKDQAKIAFSKAASLGSGAVKKAAEKALKQ